MMAADKAGPGRACERKGACRRGRGAAASAGMAPSRLLRFLVIACFCVAGAARLGADFAVDLARVSIEAAGGVPAHEALRGLRAVGVTRVGEREAGFILHAERPNRLRVESVGERGSLVRGFDGVHAPWRLDDPAQGPRRLARGEEQDFLFDAEFDSPLFDHARRGISLDHAGSELIDGRRHQKLLATSRRGELFMLFIDEETHLLTRRAQAKRIRGRETVVETCYEDFRPVAGVLLPHVIRTVVEGRVLTEARIESIEANPELPADLFAPPAPEWPRL